MTEWDIVDTDSSEPITPGTVLFEVRKQTKLSIDEVAEKLHLPDTTIQLLEADDYSQLPDITFVRGYLRNYGRLLGINEAQLVGLYDKHFTQEPEEELAAPSEEIITHKSYFERRIGVFSFLIGVVIIVLVAAWIEQSYTHKARVKSAMLSNAKPQATQTAATTQPNSSTDNSAQQQTSSDTQVASDDTQQSSDDTQVASDDSQKAATDDQTQLANNDTQPQLQKPFA